MRCVNSMTLYPMGIEGAVFESSQVGFVPTISLVFERLNGKRAEDYFFEVLKSSDCILG